MEETAQGQFEVILIAVLVIVIATSTALFIKSVATTTGSAVQNVAEENAND